MTKPVINPKYDLEKSFLEILYQIDNWINEGSGRIIEPINAEYVIVSIYSPLPGSSYIELIDRLWNSLKGLIISKITTINALSGCNWTRTQNHLVHKQTLQAI